MNHFLITCILALAGYFASAQSSAVEKRIEFDLKDGYTGEHVIEFEKEGILLGSHSEKAIDGKLEWKYDKYSTDLELVSSVNFFIEKKFYRNSVYNSQKMAHTFYVDKRGNYRLVSVEASSLEITHVKGLLPKGLRVGGMNVIGNYAYFYAWLKKAPFMLAINWETGEKRLIPVKVPGYAPKQVSISSFQVLESSKEVLVYVTAKIKKQQAQMYVIRLDDSGEEKDRFRITAPEGKSIVSISGSNVGDDRYIFTGTYSQGGTYTSEGLFFCEIKNAETRYFKLYNYLKLKDFLSYLPEKQQERIEKKKKKKAKRGQEMTLNYLIAAHEVMSVKDGYLFLGEAYYPTYRTETTTTYVNGKPTTTTRTVFDGYQYTHAVLAKFSKDGELVWDRCFAMWGSYKPYYPKRFISVPVKPTSSIDMVFTSYNRIISKSVDMEGEVLKERKSEELGASHENDKVRYGHSELNYWYGNYFIAYGSQTIKNKEDDNVKRKRKVFFVSKYKYQS